jgi:hypothetical protein
LAPNFTRRVSLAVSFPTLRRSAWTIASRSGPATEPAIGVTTVGVSGETSQPGTHTHASVFQPDPVRMPLRMAASDPLPQGRHRTIRSRSFALRHGSCLLPLKLRSLSQSGGPVFGASRISDLIAPSAVIAGRPAPSNRIAQSAMTRSLCVSRLRNRNLLAAVGSSETAGKGSPHWLTVATIGSYRLCSPSKSETADWGASLGFAAGFPIRATCCSHHGSLPLAAWLPGCCRREAKPSRRKPVTSACGRNPTR